MLRIDATKFLLVRNLGREEPFLPKTTSGSEKYCPSSCFRGASSASRIPANIVDSLALVFEARLREKESNDTRIAYDRNQFVLGIRWQP